MICFMASSRRAISSASLRLPGVRLINDGNKDFQRKGVRISRDARDGERKWRKEI